MVHIDEEALRSSLKRLRQAAFDADVVAVLKRTVNAVDDVLGYSGAGIMFITESGQLAYVAASDESGRNSRRPRRRPGKARATTLTSTPGRSSAATCVPTTAGRTCACPTRCERWRASRCCSAAVPSAP